MKDSYRVARLLRRLSGIKFLKTQQTSDISDAGKQKAQTSQPAKVKTSPSSNHSQRSGEQVSAEGNQYVRYQREIEAEKLLGSKERVKPPGRILKLPSWRKEVMSRSDDQ